MSEPLLNVMKIMLLAGLYLFFVRVLWSVYNELRDPRTDVRNARQRGRRSARTQTPAGPSASPSSNPGSTPTAARIDRAPAATVDAHSAGSAGAVAAAPIIGQLLVIEPPDLRGTSWALGNETTIGRAATCGIRLDDTYVSGVHARIFHTNGSFLIEDLDSRNGTVLNGELVPATTALRPGDRLSFGTTVLEFS